MANRPHVQRRNNAIAMGVGGVILILAVSALITILVIKPWSTTLPTKSASSVSATTTTTSHTSVTETTTEPTTSTTEETTTVTTTEPSEIPTVPSPSTVTRTVIPPTFTFEQGMCPGIQIPVDPAPGDEVLNLGDFGFPSAMMVNGGIVLRLQQPITNRARQFNNIMIQSKEDVAQDRGSFYGTKTGVSYQNLDENLSVAIGNTETYDTRYVVLCE